MKIRFIINPIAGRHPDPERTIALIRSTLDGSGVGFDYAVSEKAGDMSRLAKEAALEGIDIVASVGGDGSVNEVAGAIMGTSSALGIIPLGSGNGLARHLGIPMSTKDAVLTLLHGSLRDMDCGIVGGRPFFCTMGVGYDAKVGMDYANSGHRGLVTYADKAITGWASYHPSDYKLTIDGYSRDLSAAIITVANANQWGNNFHIAPHASISDGLLDVTVVHSLKCPSALLMPAQILGYGIDRNPAVATFRGKHISIESPAPGYYHLDGEPFPWYGGMLDINVLHKGLKIKL